MSVSIPTSKPPLLRTLETDFGTTVAEAIWGKIIQHINWMNAQFPVGLVMWFYQTTTLDEDGNPSPTELRVAAPNASWQLCNGAVVTNSNSPLFGVTLPNLLGRFPKGGIAGAIGTLGGHDNFILTHDHGGTNFEDDTDYSANRSDNGTGVMGGNSHQHSLIPFAVTISTTPLYLELQPYLRIV